MAKGVWWEKHRSYLSCDAIKRSKKETKVHNEACHIEGGQPTIPEWWTDYAWGWFWKSENLTGNLIVLAITILYANTRIAQLCEQGLFIHGELILFQLMDSESVTVLGTLHVPSWNPLNSDEEKPHQTKEETGGQRGEAFQR